MTWHDYKTPAHMRQHALIAFYRRKLARRWRWRGGSTWSATFRRDQALLAVDRWGADGFALSVDHAAYAGGR